MTLCVIDASVALSWTIESQRTPAASAMWATAGAFDFVAPSIFRTEVRNALLRAEQRNLIARADVDDALLELSAIGVLCAPEPGDDELNAAMGLARMARLSLYDALYLQLAQAEGAALASRDGALIAAARARRVAVEDCR